VSLGDQAGFALTGGGRVNVGTGHDILIGAPGRDVDPGGGNPIRTDAGTVYVVYDSATLTGTVSLGRIANGQGTTSTGGCTEGRPEATTSAFRSRFVGDVVPTPSFGAPPVSDGDIGMGAPDSDPRPHGETQPNAGTVYLADAKDLTTGEWTWTVSASPSPASS